MNNHARICLALNGLNLSSAVALVNRLTKADETAELLYAVMVHSLYDAVGPACVSALKKAGAPRVCVDYKLKDIPGTVRDRASALYRNGTDIVTVHAQGGIEMLEAARETANDLGKEIWAATLLTSLGQPEIEREYGRYGLAPSAADIVLNLARMTQSAGIGTFVCSALEVGMLKQVQDLRSLECVVPGTRSVGVPLGTSQKRSATPREALEAGAAYLVVGSEVTHATDPFAAFRNFASAFQEKVIA